MIEPVFQPNFVTNRLNHRDTEGVLDAYPSLRIVLSKKHTHKTGANDHPTPFHFFSLSFTFNYSTPYSVA